MSRVYVDYQLGGDDGEFSAEEAVVVMTDEWIAGNNYCEQTVTDLRDALRAAQQSVQRTGLRAWLIGFMSGAGVILVLWFVAQIASH